MTAKEILNNEELMKSIVEDIDDLMEDLEVTYEVWAFGYDKDGAYTETEYLIGDFADLDTAVECAKTFTLEKFNAEYEKPEYETAYLSIEVETVVPDPDEEGTMNLGTVYSRELWLNGEDSLEEDVESVVELSESDYSVLPDDNTLKVSCKLLKDYNKNDYVNIKFIDEPESFIFTYKVFSKVMYQDGDYYHLEFID